MKEHRGHARFRGALKSVPRDIARGRMASAEASVADLGRLTGADAVMALVVRVKKARKGEVGTYRIRGVIQPVGGAMKPVDMEVPQDATILGVFDDLAFEMQPPAIRPTGPPPSQELISP